MTAHSYDPWCHCWDCAAGESEAAPTPEQTGDYSLRGKCQPMAEAAAAADPTLRVVRGYFLDTLWGEQPHWWCERPDGTILDPSGAQFPSFASATPSCYIEYDGTVTCENCGKEGREGDAGWEAVGNGHYMICSYRCYGQLVGVL